MFDGAEAGSTLSNADVSSQLTSPSSLLSKHLNHLLVWDIVGCSQTGRCMSVIYLLQSSNWTVWWSSRSKHNCECSHWDCLHFHNYCSKSLISAPSYHNGHHFSQSYCACLTNVIGKVVKSGVQSIPLPPLCLAWYNPPVSMATWRQSITRDEGNWKPRDGAHLFWCLRIT